MFLPRKRSLDPPPPESYDLGQSDSRSSLFSKQQPNHTSQNHPQDSTKLLWLSLSFLHNISTPLSILASIIDEASPLLPNTTAQVMLSTINTLLKSAHLQSYSLQGTVTRRPIELASATEKLTPFLTQLALPYEFVCWLPYQKIWVNGNTAAWEQILTNLVLNSRDALLHQNKNTGKITLTIQKHRKKCVVFLRDSGSGIPDRSWQNAQRPLSPNWKPKPHGYGLRSCRFWWENAFGGEISLRKWPRWALVLSTPLHKPVRNHVY